MINKRVLALGIFFVVAPSFVIAAQSSAAKEAIEALVPISPEDLREAKEAVFNNEKEGRRSVLPVKPYIATEFFDLNSLESKVIFTRPGHQTSITFLDITGSPWPFLYAGPGNNGFTVVESLDSISEGDTNKKVNQHTMTIVPTVRFAESNLTIRLNGTQQPIVFTLVDSSSERVDFSRVFKINRVYNDGKSTPKTLPKVIAGAEQAKNSAIESFISVVPDGAVTLTTSHADVKAWEYRGKFYIRTIYDLSEDYLAIAYGVDDVRVYELDYIDSKLFFFRYGEVLAVSFKEDELVDINLSGIRGDKR
jgi:intracellular multiplication protein IcmK